MKAWYLHRSQAGSRSQNKKPSLKTLKNYGIECLLPSSRANLQNLTTCFPEIKRGMACWAPARLSGEAMAWLKKGGSGGLNWIYRGVTGKFNLLVQGIWNNRLENSVYWKLFPCGIAGPGLRQTRGWGQGGGGDYGGVWGYLDNTHFGIDNSQNEYVNGQDKSIILCL